MRMFQTIDKILSAPVLAVILFTADLNLCPAQTADQIPLSRRAPLATERPKVIPPAPPKADEFRVVNGQMYNIRRSQLWQDMNGQVQENEGNVFFLLTGSGKYVRWIAVKNLPPAQGISGREIQFRGMPTGRYQWGDKPLELWDCGTPPQPKVIQPAAITTNHVVAAPTRPKPSITNTPSVKTNRYMTK